MNFFANNTGKKFEENYKIKKVLGKGKYLLYFIQIESHAEVRLC